MISFRHFIRTRHILNRRKREHDVFIQTHHRGSDSVRHYQRIELVRTEDLHALSLLQVRNRITRFNLWTTHDKKLAIEPGRSLRVAMWNVEEDW